ncbi:MAG: hypothetical protein ING19_20650 [Azospirillum sp.]|nr:hypothetical protein [Azospirillum sp.]
MTKSKIDLYEVDGIDRPEPSRPVAARALDAWFANAEKPDFEKKSTSPIAGFLTANPDIADLIADLGGERRDRRERDIPNEPDPRNGFEFSI